MRVSCTGPAHAETVRLTVPAGDTSGAALVGGLPVGSVCSVVEVRPSAPWQAIGVTPAAVVVGLGEPASLTASNALQTYRLTVHKRVTGAALASSATFEFLVACADPQFDRTLRVTVPVGAATASVGGIPTTVACTVSEPEQAGWAQLSRAPANGAATAAAADVTFVNSPTGGLAATGAVAVSPWATYGVAAIVCGAILSFAGRRRRPS